MSWWSESPVVVVLGVSALLLAAAAVRLLFSMRWSARARGVTHDAIPSLRRVERERSRWTAAHGTVVLVEGLPEAPVRQKPAALYRFQVFDGQPTEEPTPTTHRKLVFEDHRRGPCRLSDGTGVLEVDLGRARLLGPPPRAPQRLTASKAALEHRLKELFPDDAATWFEDPRLSWVEVALCPGDEVLAYGRVRERGGRVVLEARFVSLPDARKDARPDARAAAPSTGATRELAAALRRERRRARVHAFVLTLLALGVPALALQRGVIGEHDLEPARVLDTLKTRFGTGEGPRG